MQECSIDKHFATDVYHFGCVVYMTPPAPPKTALLPIHPTRRHIFLVVPQHTRLTTLSQMVCTSSELPPDRKGVFYWSLKKSFQYEKVNFARAMQVLGDDDKWSENVKYSNIKRS